ncbi:MAG: SOS response-associated peptidase family protein [Nitrosospira sp.]
MASARQRAASYSIDRTTPEAGPAARERLSDGRKQPFYISSRDGNPLSFAGVWDTARLEGRIVDSCAIITPDCNALMQPIHDGMPVILREDDWDTWHPCSCQGATALVEAL